MNRKELISKRKEMIALAKQNNGNITKAKKFILNISIVWVILRLVHIVFEYYVAIKFTNEYNAAVTNTVMLIVLAMFISTIYNGFKALAILPIVGGILSIVRAENLFKFIYEAYKVGDLLVFSYYSTFFIVMLMQVVLMILILINKNCKEYFDTMSDIYKQLQGNYPRKL